MKHIQPAFLSAFFKSLVVLSLLFSAIDSAHAQCPVPYPKGDIDSTLRNVPVATVVTRDDISSFGSGVPLTNDSLSIVTNPQHGTVVVLNDSTILYTPTPGFVGTDLYVYRVCNNCGNCAVATVTIEVRSYCPAPTAFDDYYTVYNNAPNSLNVTSNDVNIAGGQLKVSLLRHVSHGTDSVITDALTGKIWYQSTIGYLGSDTLSYIVCDSCPGSKCDTALVYLNVITCQPLDAHNDTFTLLQAATISADLAVNDINTSGFGVASITLLNAPKYGSTASLSGTLISYTAGGSGFGKDTLAYRICTDCGCDTAYAIFTVTPRPCTKPHAVADHVFAGYALNCTGSYNVIGNDTLPINGGQVSLSILTQGHYGTTTVTGTILHYTCTDTTRKGLTDTVIYAVCNGCFCDTAIVTVNITNYPCNGVNPVVNNDTVHVCRNYPVTIRATGNDYDPEGGTVSVGTITQGMHGVATRLNADYIVYVPATNFSGHDVFTYQACDNGVPSLCNTATVDVFVENCNHAPVILNTASNPTDTVHVYVAEDSSLQYCIKYTQQDSPYVAIKSIRPSLDTVTAIAGLNTYGTAPCINIVPPTGSRTEQTVQVIICNKYPLCDTVDVIISILPRNHAPVAHNDTLYYVWPGCANIDVVSNDVDPDQAEHLTITAFDSATTNSGTIVKVGDSTLCYTPASYFAGVDTIHYTVCDASGACSSAILIVHVPVLARPDAATTLQDQPVVISVTINDTKGVNELILLCSVPLHGSAVIDSGNAIHYTPEHDYPFSPLNNDTIGAGKDSFCYTICSITGTDTSCSSAMVYITVTPKGKFYIPQGISPDGDGINDKFIIVSADEFPKSQLLVYNRWGDEVWRNDGDGYQNDFDGTWKKNNQPLPDGSYWYIFKFNDNVHTDKVGYVVIQR